MINAITTIVFIVLLFFTGKLVECLKYLLKLIVTVTLKILNLIGINVSITETTVKTSKLFKNTFQEIKVVKRSRQNKKIKTSINVGALLMLLCSLSLIILNLSTISNNAITNWIFSLGVVNFVVDTAEDMNVIFTALMFSVVSFSISKLINQWKETASSRQTKRDIKAKGYVLSKISTQELLDYVKQRDTERYSKLKSVMKNDRNKE